MKANFLFTLLVTSFIFISCGDDEDKKNEDRIIGTWVAVLEEFKECNNPADNATNNLVCTESNCIRLTFNGDGTYELVETENLAGITEVGNWKLSGSTLTFTFSDEDEETTYSRSFTIASEILILTYISDSTGCMIETTYNPEEEQEEEE